PCLPVSLSPLGAALLGRDDGVWPADPAPSALRVAPLLERTGSGTTVILDAPAGLPLLDRFALEAILPPDPAAPGCYPLARSDLLHALQRGRTIAGVVNFLERASGEPLPAPVLGILYRWAEELDRVTIRQTVLLQTNDPGLLRELTSQRRIRQTLGKTLNARTVEVRADRLDALLRRLAHRDIVPRLDLAPLTRRQAGRVGGEGEAEQAAIVAALRVYAHLAEELGLPTHPVYALAQRWSERLPLPIRDAVKATVEQTLKALHRAAPVEMEDRLPEPTGPLLDVLEAAIEEHATVEIEYYTAGRAHTTTRRVEPLRLEWRGKVIYLIAHCHLRGDQRVFRVDRIERMSE
ncbi:MAG: WYL domain-containing protein, partial [Chloroflexota bacterium]|nr:WYL domain-containing protein [Chloroflexota bacterium]